MVIRVLDLVDRCYTNDDGAAVLAEIKPYVVAMEPIRLSFDGVSSVTSSFINSSLIPLLDSVDFADIKRTLAIVDARRVVAGVIARRFEQEISLRESI